MSKTIPIFLTLILLSFFISVMSTEPMIDDDNDIEELLAVDAEEEGNQQQGNELKSSQEATTLTKAQRIVLELSNERIKDVLDGNEYVLVLGYAPWCGRSAELMPRFAEAATTLKEMGSPVLMAKLDAERYPNAASGLGIKGFPTLLLFVNGSSQSYTGGFTSEEIVIWVRKRTAVPIIRLASVPEAEKFMGKYQMFAVGLFGKFEGDKYEEFTKAAVADNEIQFAETSSTEIAEVLFPDRNAKDIFLGLVKSEPEKYVRFDDAFEKEKMLEFLEYNKFPLVTVMTEMNSVKIHSSPLKLQVIIFAEEDDFKNLILLLQNVARKFQSKIMFIYVDIAEENLAKPFLTLFGLEESDKTVVVAFDNKRSSKYLLESDPTPSNLEKNATVQTVVGRTFSDLVLKSPQNVLLEVHTPWCINCESTSKQVEKLAKHFKGLDDLIIARIDASSNEHQELQVDEFPSLLFYPSGNKSNPIKLPTKSSSKELAALVKKYLRAEVRGISTDDQTTKDEL
ncbi:hypothetical protein IFM89_023061 [Coptis chinensis]|uniref:protein disulfide-isomerase n=1 Tax=Coptis chinensis TaxID=261450 RepID=A0A835M1E9_9MAGN|nr:hypothetical protein IFM89_023061 [Coptis chinensis]